MHISPSIAAFDKDVLWQPSLYSREELIAAVDFWLSPADLQLQATVFSAYAAEFGTAAGRLDEYEIANHGGYPLFADILPAASRVKSVVVQWVRHLESCLEGVNVELNRVAVEAQNADLMASAVMDRVDPGLYQTTHLSEMNDLAQRRLGHEGHVAPESDRVSDGLVERVTRGTSFYLDPGLPSPELNDLPAMLIPGDALDVGFYLGVALEETGQAGLLEELMKVFGGPWGDLRHFCQMVAAENGGGAVGLSSAAHDAIRATAARVAVHWQGFSANSAQEYFVDLLSAMYSGSREIQAATRRFTQLIDQIADIAQQTRDLLLSIAAEGAILFAEKNLFGNKKKISPAPWLLLLKIGMDVRDIYSKIEMARDLVEAAKSNLQVIELEKFVSSFPVPAMKGA